MSGTERQRVEKVTGARRARLTAAPGTTPEPVPADIDTDAPADESGAGSRGSRRRTGPNDEQLRRDKPPHY